MVRRRDSPVPVMRYRAQLPPAVPAAVHVAHELTRAPAAVPTDRRPVGRVGGVVVLAGPPERTWH